MKVMGKMKTEFQLENLKGDMIVGSISIQSPELDVCINAKQTYSYIKSKDLERFAVNILKAIGSKKLK